MASFLYYFKRRWRRVKMNLSLSHLSTRKGDKYYCSNSWKSNNFMGSNKEKFNIAITILTILLLPQREKTIDIAIVGNALTLRGAIEKSQYCYHNINNLKVH